MKTRINKYLVGALLCAITHNGYSMEAEKKGIEALDSEELQHFATTVLNCMKNTKIKAMDNYKITKDNKEISFREEITPLITSDKKEDIEKALNEILQLTAEDWTEIGSRADKWNVIKAIYNGQKIGDTELKDIKAMKEETLKAIQEALTKAKCYDKYMYIIDDSQTMQFLKNKKHNIVTNEKEILHDNDSKIKIAYRDKKKNLETAIITISEETIPENRLKKILDDNKKDYKFFKEDENDSIRAYMAKELAKDKPTTQRAKDLLTTLHTTEIGTENAAGEAIREYLQRAQNYQDKVKNVYKGCSKTLPANGNLDELLKQINKDLKITEKDYTIGYLASQDLINQLKKIEQDYKIKLEGTNLKTHRFNTNDTNEQMNSLRSQYMSAQLFKRVQELTETNANLTKTNKDNETKLNEAVLKQDELQIEKETLEKQLNEKQTEADQAKAEKTTLETTKNELETKNKELAEKNEELSNENEDLTNYANSLTNILGLPEPDPENLANTYNAIQAAVKKLQDKTPIKGADAKEIKDRDIKIKTLEGQITKLTKQIKDGGSKDNIALNEEINNLKESLKEKEAQITSLQEALNKEKNRDPENKDTIITKSELAKIFSDMRTKAKNTRYTLDETLNNINAILKKAGQSPIAKPEEEK